MVFMPRGISEFGPELQSFIRSGIVLTVTTLKRDQEHLLPDWLSLYFHSVWLTISSDGARTIFGHDGDHARAAMLFRVIISKFIVISGRIVEVLSAQCPVLAIRSRSAVASFTDRKFLNLRVRKARSSTSIRSLFFRNDRKAQRTLPGRLS